MSLMFNVDNVTLTSTLLPIQVGFLCYDRGQTSTITNSFCNIDTLRSTQPGEFQKEKKEREREREREGGKLTS